MSADLWEPDAVSPLLAWLPDETLFSLCSRHHRLSGRGVSAETTRVLFGHRSGGSQHDLPNRISEFCRRTGNTYGTAERLAREKTALAFYAPFLGEPAVATAVLAMSGPSVAHLKYRLGLLTSRFRANHPLKACVHCMNADLDLHGWVFWHREHQFPGVWVCPMHQTTLGIATVKSTGVGRFQWHLPADTEISSDWAIDHDVTELARLAELTVTLVRQARPDGWLEPSAVQATLKERMVLRGWVTSGGGYRLGAAAGDFLRVARELRVASELSALPSTLEEAKSQIGRLVRPARSGTHPLRLLVAIAWLFDDAQDFITSHDRCALRTAAEVNSATGSHPPLDEGAPEPSVRALAPHTELLQLLSDGKAVSAAAKDLGVDVATAIAWATQAGIQTRRRPKVLKPEVRSVLVTKLRRGADKEEVARSAGISVETVTRLLRSEVGLHAEWRAARFSAAQVLARSAWTSVWNEHHAVGVKLMRAMAPSAYAWLYRNDREWLRQHTPSPEMHAGNAGMSSVRWDERDERLSQAVREAALRLTASQAPGGLRLWQIYQVVPELKAKLARLGRLPLTRRALDEALSRRVGPQDQSSLFN